LGVMLAIALLLQDKLAEDTLSKIDQQIAAFRSLSVEVRAELRSQAEDHEKKESFSGKILLKDGGKARLDLLRVRDNKESSMLIISNGTTVADTREGETLETPTPKDFNKNFSLAALALTGVTKAHMLTFEVSAPVDYDVRRKGALSNVRVEPDEGELKSLSYTLTFGAHTSTVRVWYSPTDLRPLKRELVWKAAKARVTMTETYMNYLVNADIPDEKFAIPVKK